MCDMGRARVRRAIACAESSSSFSDIAQGHRQRDMRLPSLKFLKTFQVAAARLSFKAAAEELCITPSAVSHQIKALEEQLAVSLFDRGPHSLTLTDAGEYYLQHIDSMFSRLESVTEQLKIRFGRGVVRLHMPPFFATELLMPKLPALLESQPDTDIHINTALAPLQTHPSDADVSIVVNATPDSGLDCHKLFSQAFVPACSPSLLLRSPINTVGTTSNRFCGRNSPTAFAPTRRADRSARASRRMRRRSGSASAAWTAR